MSPKHRKQMLSVAPKCPYFKKRKEFKVLFLGHLTIRDVLKTK